MATENTSQKIRRFKIHLYTLFFISFTPGLTALLLSWQDNNTLVATVCSIFLIALSGMLIYIEYSTTKSSYRIELVSHRGMLCGDPFCERCRGWYLTFCALLVSIWASPGFWVDFCSKVIPYSFIISLIVFIVVAPLHGGIGRIFQNKGNDSIKLFLGGVSAISLVIMIASIVAMYNK